MLILTILGLLATPLWATSSTPTLVEKEIKVKLFGQLCLLKGPFPESTLKIIDTVSPAQVIAIPENLSLEEGLTESSLRDALARLQNAENLPSELGVYQDKLTSRLKALLKFFEGLKPESKSQKPKTREAILLESVEKAIQYTPPGPLHNKFKALAKELPNTRARVKANSSLKGIEAQLLEIYLKLITPEPEEEFHRALRVLNVHYVCSFDETSPGSNPPSPSQD